MWFGIVMSYIRSQLMAAAAAIWSVVRRVTNPLPISIDFREVPLRFLVLEVVYCLQKADTNVERTLGNSTGLV